MPGRITLRLVLAVTAAYFGMSVPELLSDRRTHPLVHRRQIAFYIAHRMTGRGFLYIGRRTGRDHTTVLHACRAVEALAKAGDAETVQAVNRIVGTLTGGANV